MGVLSDIVTTHIEEDLLSMLDVQVRSTSRKLSHIGKFEEYSQINVVNQQHFQNDVPIQKVIFPVSDVLVHDKINVKCRSSSTKDSIELPVEELNYLLNSEDKMILNVLTSCEYSLSSENLNSTVLSSLHFDLVNKLAESKMYNAASFTRTKSLAAKVDVVENVTHSQILNKSLLKEVFSRKFHHYVLQPTLIFQGEDIPHLTLDYIIRWSCLCGNVNALKLYLLACYTKSLICVFENF